MSVLQLRTYADIYTAIREEIQIPSTDTTAISRIKRDINIIYQEACAAHKWRWLKGFRDLTLPAYVSLGTVSVTQGSNQVTLSQSIASSKTGYKFSVQGFMEVYTISHHAAGSSVFSLDTSFNGATNATATYQIWTDRIPLPTDAREVTEAWCDIYRQNLDTLGLQEYRRMVSLSPKNQGRPFVYYVGDFVDPTQLQTIPSLPSLLTRSSNGVIKMLVFSTALPTAVVTSITNGDPVKWNIANAGQGSYNGDVLISSIGQTNVANDTVTYTGLSPYQESGVADTAMAFTSLSQEQSYNRYREMFLYPCLTNTNTAVHVDYVKEILPLNNDDDEPLMPVEDRIVLLYGALARAWTRARNETEAARNRQQYDAKLGQMAGKLQGDFDKPKLQPSKMYLSSKRNQVRKSQVESSSPFGFGGSGGGSNPTGPGNTVAVFNGNGDLNGSSTVSTTVLNYLQGLTGNVQAQINAAASATLSQGNIFVGNTSGIAAGVPMSGDVSINTTGATTVLTVGGATDTNIASATTAALAATNANTASTIVKRDSSGNFSAGTITAALSGNASTATSATTATTAGAITGNLTGDVTSSGMATTLATVATPGTSPKVTYNAKGLVTSGTTLSSADIPNNAANTTGTAANITATSNSTLTTLSVLSLPGSQVSGNISGHAASDLLASNNLSDVGTKATAFNNISPVTTTGDLIIGTGTNTAGRLAIGSNNTVLTSNGTTASWAAAGTASPLTTKGDVYTYSTTNARLGVGTDNQALIADSSQTTGLRWSTLQQGAKNYLTYNNFENNATTGWSLFNTTLTGVLPTGSISAGAGSINTFSTYTSGQLAGTYSLQMGGAGTTITAGQGVITQAYTIDKEDQAKVLTYKFYYSGQGSTTMNFSGTSSNTWAVYFYDTANSQWVQPAGVYGMTQSSGVGYCTGTFQTASNTTSYQMAILCINGPSSGSNVLQLDDFYLGPQTAPLGAVVTDWVAYTPTFTGFGTVSSVSVYSRRVGDSLQVRGSVLAGTTTATPPLMTLGYNGGNGNVTIDGTKVVATQLIGSAASAIFSTTQFNWDVLAGTAGGNTVGFGIQTSTISMLTSTTNASSVAGSSAAFHFFFQVPISGWSSNVQMSSDTDTRVIDGQLSTISSSTATANTAFVFTTTNWDVAGGFQSLTGYKVPVTGYYDVKFVGANASAGSANVAFNVNGVVTGPAGLINTTTSCCLVHELKLNAGDLITVVPQQSFTVNTGGSAYFSVARRSGPSVIAATESVNATYGLTTLVTPSANSAVKYDTKVKDSHNAYNPSTGIYIIPVSGSYQVTASVTSGGGTTDLYLTRNSTSVAYVATVNGANFSGGGGVVWPFNAGDAMSLNIDTSRALTAAGAQGFLNYFSIVRVGN